MSNLLISLELQGYKTFASKTDFKFPAQLTAIVGPNGSGKSNIADSIRWVLGEQAYSLLRGKKTVDMIFSGSEQRPRASMASVSITFDNASGWLPIDFNEVNLTRRAYRNGENEYLINNQKVRLKEINELLANSGLAERNYTIIGQGLVDSALSLKPEDRRSFFEEAAGIGLYRSRRSEANRKLERTLRNVERINDIISELKPRLRSLEKQQEKSQSYKQIEADLQLLLKDWYGYHWHRTQKDLQAAIKVNATQQENVNLTRTKRKNLEEQLEASQKTLQEKRKRLSELHHELSSYHDEKEDNARQVAVLEERQQSQKLRIAEFQRSFEMDQARINALENEIDEQINVRETSSKELQRMQQDLRGAQTQLENRLGEREKIETKIISAEESLSHNSQEILRLQTQIESLNKQINLRESDMIALMDRINKNQEMYSETENKLNDLKEQVVTKKKVLEADESKRSGLIEKSSSLAVKIDDLKDNQSKCENLKQNLEGQYALLIEAEKTLVGYTSGTKSVLDALRSGKLGGNYHMLMDLLNIPKKYEVAIASALGVIVEGIIIESPQDTESIIDFISQSNIQRTILIENREIQQDRQSIYQSDLLINAAEIVNQNNEGKQTTIVKNLLSSIYIAEDRSIARKLIDGLPSGIRIVTLAGEVFSTEGTIIVGKETHTKNFERKREKEKVKQETQKTHITLSEIKNKINKLQKELNETQSALESINSQILEKQSSTNQIEMEIYKLEIEQTQRNEQTEIEKRRLDDFEIGIENENNNVTELKNKITELETISHKKKNQIKTLYLEMEELPVEDLRMTVMDLHSKLAVAQKINENDNNRLREKQNQLIKYRDDWLNAKERIDEIKAGLSALVAKLEELKNRDKEVNKEIERLSEESGPLESKVEHEITNQGTFLEVVDAARQQYAIAERHKMQAQLKVEKLRERLEQYQQKIGEDFGIFIGEEDHPFGPKPLPIEGIVAQLPKLETLPSGISDQISQKKSLLRRLGPVNPIAEQEYEEVSTRFHFLSDQLKDLDKAQTDLQKIVQELDELMKKEFLQTFNKVAVEFENIFSELFNGGAAKLVIDDAENLLESGIDIEATLPGRRKQELALLSGGERSLTAVALIFALLKISPTPFCILDEIDAMLDESNVMRVGEMLKELSDTTQFIIITHNRNTVQLADVIYGVTMGKDSVSQVISLRLDELTDEMVN